jgi:hypothetical protein
LHKVIPAPFCLPMAASIAREPGRVSGHFARRQAGDTNRKQSCMFRHDVAIR